MNAVYLHALRRLSGQILGWGLGLAGMGLLVVLMYPVILKRQEEINRVLESMPAWLQAVAGGAGQFASASGWLHAKYFSTLPLVLGIFAVLGGSGLLAPDEESGRLDLMLSYPVRRRTFFLARLAALATALAAILGLAWLGILAGSLAQPLGIGAARLLLPFVSLMAVSLAVAGLALAASLVLPGRRHAGMFAGIVLAASFFLSMFARVDERISPYARLMPVEYYQGGEAVDRFLPSWIVVLGVLTAAELAVAWRLFERRDIRTGGDGDAKWRRVALLAAGWLVLAGALAWVLPPEHASTWQIPVEITG